MRTTVIAAAAALILVPGATMAESRSYDLASFNRIDIATGLNAVVTHGDTQSVRIETRQDGILDKIDISVLHGELRVKREGSNLLDIILSGGILNMLGKDRDATVYITIPQLVGVQASSGASLSADRASGDVADFSASSGASIELDAADVGALQLNASSGGDLVLAGSCDTLELNFSSGGHIDAPKLDCVDLHVSGSSGGSAEVTASGEITGRVSSGANLGLHGHPGTINVRSSSGGDVTLR